MSFRSAKTEASLRLYSLPRRELQALCKQYGIPANKTNVKMADALSACIPVENARTKAWAGASSLGVSKTTPMKVKLERKTGLPETSLASFILNGKRKISPVKTGLVADMEEASFPKPNTTPLKRGIKRTERPMQMVEEEKFVSAAPAFTRAAAAALHEGKSVNSPKPGAPTPRKRTAEIAAVVTRRGGDALPPVSFSDLLSTTPKKSVPQVPEIIQLSTGKTAKKMKSRLGSKTSPKEEETALPRASRGKRVAFADEVELENREPKDLNPASDQGNQLEPETETIEISYDAEIEFKNTPLLRELLGVRRSSPVDEELHVAAAPIEAEHREDVPESSEQVGFEFSQGFEFRDMALHKELFGSKSETNNALSPLELQRAATFDNAIDSELGISNSPFTCSPEVLDYSNMALGLEHTVLSSIRENASDESGSKVVELDEHTQNHLPQGRDLSPLVDDLACDDIAEMGVPVVGDAQSPVNESQNDCIPTPVQEPTALSLSADVPLVMQEEGIQQQQPDSHTVDSMVDSVLEMDSFEETHVSSTPVLDEGRKVHTFPTPKSAEVRRSPQGLTDQDSTPLLDEGRKVHTFPTPKSAEVRRSPQGLTDQDSTPVLDEGRKVHTFPTPKSAEVRRSPLGLTDKDDTKASPSVITSGSKLVMPGPSASMIPITPLTKIQSNTDSPLARAVTPLTKIQSNIDSTLAKATSILEKLAAWRADAERKVKEGYWEPKFSSVVENASPAAVLKTPIAKPADKGLPSAKKARPTPKATTGSEKVLVVCEDTDIGSKGEVPSITTTRISEESKDSSEVSDKENVGEKRKLRVVGKEKKQGKKFEVLKDRSKNGSDHTGTGQVRPEDMSLRKLRAQVKEKVRQLETSKVSAQRSWN